MRARRVAFWLFVFVSVDFGTPFVGGAFTFDAGSSAEGVRVRYESGEAQGRIPCLPPSGRVEPDRKVGRTSGRTGPSPRLTECWMVDRPRAHALSEAPPARSEDH